MKSKKEQIGMDGEKEVATLRKARTILRDRMGSVSVSHDTELVVMVDYLDFLIEAIEEFNEVR